MRKHGDNLVLRCTRFAEATCSRILDGFCKSHRDFMIMCCLEAASTLVALSVRELATGGGRERSLCSLSWSSAFSVKLSSSLYKYCWALRHQFSQVRMLYGDHLTCSSIKLVSPRLFAAASCAGGLIPWGPSYSLS
jgi:hypothetical protein